MSKQIYFLKIKATETLGLRRHTRVCVRKYRPVYAARVLEIFERQVFYINIEVWNKSHIIWEPFQIHIFSPYKTIHDTFSKRIENPKG